MWLLKVGGANIAEVDNNGDSALILAASTGELKTVRGLVQEGGASIGEANNDGHSALTLAASTGELKTIRWLLQEGGASIGETDNGGSTALISAANAGRLGTVRWLLQEGGASIGDADNHGWTALLAAAFWGKVATVQYLLEHGGADIGDTLNGVTPIWDLLADFLVEGERDLEDDIIEPYVYDATAVTSLLRVIMLRGAPPAELRARLSPVHAQVVENGARLRAGLPTYLVRRQAFLDAHCPLIPPLRALVHCYEVPTTTDELWATGLGVVRQWVVRPRADEGAADAVPLRRSLRLRQKRE
jgi:hypothetical protein